MRMAGLVDDAIFDGYLCSLLFLDVFSLVPFSAKGSS